MFNGDILTPDGWQAPNEGLVIACMDMDGRIQWQPIARSVKKEGAMLDVDGCLLRYQIGMEHVIPVISNESLKLVSGQSLWQSRQGRLGHGQIRYKHLVRAYPNQSIQNSSAILGFVMVHLGGRVVPHCQLLELTDALSYRPVYPNVFLQGVVNRPYCMGAVDAMRILAMALPMMRARNKFVRTIKTAASDMLQAALFFSGVMSLVKDGRVRAYFRSKSSASPLAPTITPNTKVKLTHGSGFEIDVRHPLVRLDGRITIL